MNFANLAALWYLLPLAGTIILLYLLKMRRKDFNVPATFLWPKLTTEVRANSLLQKLKFSWLMVLQLIAISLIVAALARPQTQQEGLAGSVTVFVLDTSASMSADDADGTRFDDAVARVRKAVSTAKPGDRFSLVEASTIPRVALPLSRDPARMRDALNSLSPTDAECDMAEALRLAAALVGTQESGHIVLLSDGAFGEIENFSRGKAALHFQQVGSSSDNVAITAMGVADSTAGKQLYCGVRNYSANNKAATLSFYAEGKLFNSKKIEVVAGKAVGETSNVPPGANILEARIEVDDALPADNFAFVVADPRSTLRVLLITKGNIFLERALALDPRVTLDIAAALPENDSVYDIVVFDGVAEAKTNARGVLTFGAAGPPSIVRAVGSASKPRVSVSDDDSALMKYVDLSSTFIDKAERVEPKQGAKVLVDSNQGPVIVASDIGKKQIYVGFSVLDSDFALQIGFPIFVSNALDYMAGQAASDVVAIKTGKTLSFPATAEDNASLKSPDGSQMQIEPAGGSYALRSLKKSGKYVFEYSGKITTIYASVLNDKESEIGPAKNLQLEGGEVQAAKAPARIADFWRPLALLCLAVLAGEWWLFARKS